MLDALYGAQTKLNTDALARLHGLPQYAAYKGLSPLQAPLRLEHVHELPLPYTAVGGRRLCSLLCPGCSRKTAITPEHQPLHAPTAQTH